MLHETSMMTTINDYDYDVIRITASSSHIPSQIQPLLLLLKEAGQSPS